MKLTPYLYLISTFALMGFLCIYPLIYSLYISLFDYTIRYPLKYNFILFENYLNVIQDWRFWNALKVTSLFTIAAVSIEFLIGFGLALLLNEEVKGKATFRTILLLPMMVTPVCVGILWRFMYNPEFSIINYFLSLVNGPQFLWLSQCFVAPFAVILSEVWQWTPFMFLILYSGLQALPKAPLEAAKIDGASQLQIFRYVLLPLLKPIIAVALILRAIDAVKIYDIVYVETKGGPALSTDTLSLYIYRVSFDHLNTGYGGCLSIVFLIVVLVAISTILPKFIRFERR